MAFSFGFVGDDVDSNEAIDQGGVPISESDGVTHGVSLPTKRHSTEELLSTLPSCLSYNYLAIPLWNNDTSFDLAGQLAQRSPVANAGTFIIPRRSLFDIRIQLMAESNFEENSHDDFISGLDTGDLSSGFYEGGLKTWECAIDLAAFVASHVKLSEDQTLQVIELGAGSGIPSLALLQMALGGTRLGEKNIKFTFCDYNEEVLKLVTIPNVLLSWWEFCVKRCGIGVQEVSLGEADLDDIDEGMAQRFINDCKRRGVSFDFISGAWGSSFVDLIRDSLPSEADVFRGQQNVIVLASETIYSPASLASFVTTVADLLRMTKSGGTAFVAAKRIYFGVGGDVPEFVQQMRKVGASVKEIINITDNGVNRVILEISIA